MPAHERLVDVGRVRFDGQRRLYPDLLICDCCDSVLSRPRLRPHETARCPHCSNPVMRGHSLSLSGQLALTLTALIAFCLANFFPVVELQVAGRTHGSTLPGAALQLWRDGSAFVAACTLAFGFVFPLLEIVLRLAALLAVRRAHEGTSDGAIAAIRWLAHVQRWSMVEVYLIGMLVTIFKIGSMASVIVDVGLVGAAALTVLTGALRTTGLHSVIEPVDRMPPGGDGRAAHGSRAAAARMPTVGAPRS